MLKSISSLRGMRGTEIRARGRCEDEEECCGEGRGWCFSRLYGEGMGTYCRPRVAL